MEENQIKYKEKGTYVQDCARGCEIERNPQGELSVTYNRGCCKLADFDWMEGIQQDRYKDLYEVRFKNTRKAVYRNDSGQILKIGDIVVVEAANGHDVGIITLEGPTVLRGLTRKKIDPATAEFKKIYRRAKILDIERWQEAISREHQTMIRARQLAARLGLDMKIGDVEFQGDGTKAIFYYIADARVDFRQLIKDFAEEFHIRIEMKQIGARQEAGLIGGIGVCGRALCCSRHISDFQSITTQAARCQDLSLNPQKLAGQCSKLKCCINFEASTYIDAQSKIPHLRGPIELEDGQAYLMKTDILSGTMYFSYDKDSMAKLFALPAEKVRQIISDNRKGVRSAALDDQIEHEAPETDFVSAAGDESITRFDEKKRRKNHHRGRGGNGGGNGGGRRSGGNRRNDSKGSK